MRVLDIYYGNNLYYLIIAEGRDLVETLNDLGEYKTFKLSELDAFDYKGNVFDEVGLIRLFK